MPGNIPKPPYDPELIPFLNAFPLKDLTPDGIPALREIQNSIATLEGTLAGEPFNHEERSVPGPNGPVTLSIFHPQDGQAAGQLRPVIYHMHMGGMVVGNRFSGFKDVLRWGKATGAICIGVEYRLSPEHKFPVGLEDCYAGLSWIGSHLEELGIDPSRLLVAGQSAGGNLATCLALMARDRGGPKLCGLLLDCPMLDDSNDTVSARQFIGDGTWTHGSNETAWAASHGSDRAERDLGRYATAMREKDLSGLPPTFICVGSAEVFRDEDVAFAQRLWAAGVQTELHVWPGGYHCFDMLVPDATVSKASIEARTAWVKRIFETPVSKL